MGTGLERITRGGVTVIGRLDGAIAFGFTERTGGVSRPPYDSLNLGAHVGDESSAVEENRTRVLAAMDAAPYAARLLVPNQVHGDHVAVVSSTDPESLSALKAELAAGTDAIVCTVPYVPVMLCFADCVPVILVCPQGFAVVHSGWKGTYARIAAQAARVLMEQTGCTACQIEVWIGPHILGDEYEVSEELIAQFRERFGAVSPSGARLLDLSRAIAQPLVEAGIPAAHICDLNLSTMRENDRFFSYRAEGGICGRHAAVAMLRAHGMEDQEW